MKDTLSTNNHDKEKASYSIPSKIQKTIPDCYVNGTQDPQNLAQTGEVTVRKGKRTK